MLVGDKMESSRFTVEQLGPYGKHYKRLCEAFFSLASDEDTLIKLKGILYDGFVGDYHISSGVCTNKTIENEIDRRVSMAYLLINNPDTFNFFVENNINLFHGTNFNALPGTLKYGLRSISSLIENNLQVLSGEKRYYGAIDSEYMNKPIYGVNVIEYISFTDSLNVAESYFLY